MGEQTDKKTEVKRPAAFLGLLSWFALFLGIYVLGSGPVIRMEDKRMLNASMERLLDRFYSPLGWVYQNTPLHKPLGMYFHLWSNKFFDSKGELNQDVIVY